MSTTPPHIADAEAQLATARTEIDLQSRARQHAETEIAAAKTENAKLLDENITQQLAARELVALFDGDGGHAQGQETLAESYKRAERYVRELAAARSEVARLRETLPLRPVVAWFAQQMETVLLANDHKGGWDPSDIGYLKDRLREECVELEMALDARPNDQAQREAVDVANFAMMIADSLRPEGTLQNAAKEDACWELVEARAELAAAREEQDLETRVFEALAKRYAENSLHLRKHGVEPWMAVVRERDGKEKVHEAATLPALLRAILETEIAPPTVSERASR